LYRIGKRLTVLTPDEVALYETLLEAHRGGQKLDSQQAKALWELGKRL
jgi:hypothetical protein